MKNLIVIILLVTLISLLVLFCIVAILIIIKKQNKKENRFKKRTNLYNLAFVDGLTYLFNRNAYNRDIKRLNRKKTENIWFTIFDIDYFKTINDTKGHLFGDKVLISAADRLCAIFKEKNHTVYRFGGDEFLVISTNICEADLMTLITEIRNAEDICNDFGFSIGYSLVEKNGPESFDIAYDIADKKLYAEKDLKKKHNN